MSVVVHHFAPGAAPRPTERRGLGRRARRIGLATFFASVVVNAGLGIYAVLTPDFGETAQRILVTSLCVTGSILLALSCEPAWERGLLGPVPAAGALLGAAAFAGLIVGVWTEPASETLRNLLWSTFAIAIACTAASLLVLERARKGIAPLHQRVLTFTLAFVALAAAVAVGVIWARPTEDTVGKIGGSGYAIAAACALAGFLTLARLAQGHRWVLDIALGLLALGAASIIAGIWAEEGGGVPIGRIMGVALISFAAFAVSVPVLHWIDRGVVAAEASTSTAVRYCPHCGGKLAGEVGVEARCDRCGRAFIVSTHISA
jgi:hypothetical protein